MTYLAGTSTHHKFAVGRHCEDATPLPLSFFFSANIHVAPHEVCECACAGFKRESTHGKVDECREDAELCSALQFALVVVAESLVEVDTLTLISGFTVTPKSLVDLRETFTHDRMLNDFERLELVDFFNSHL